MACFFGSFLGSVLGAKQTSQRSPRSMPKTQKTLPREVEGPSPQRLPQNVVFLSIFEVPGTLKIELSLTRELNFQGSRTPQIDTFSVLFLRPSWERLRSLFFHIFCRFWTHFGPHLGSWGDPFRTYSLIIFWDALLMPFFVKNGSKMAGGPTCKQSPSLPSSDSSPLRIHCVVLS